MSEEFTRQSDVDGFTIVYRFLRAPKIHLLRAWESCNTDDARRKQKVEGSREVLLTVLKGKRAVACQRCFPGPKE
jgi:hypothetical protein